jgi:hypothetical protein
MVVLLQLRGQAEKTEATFARMKLLLAVAALVSCTALVIGPYAHASGSTCLIRDLSVAPGGEVSPTTGAHPIALRLVNHGAACVLQGYPVVALRDARGLIPFVYRHGGDAMVTPRRPTRVALRHGASAFFLLDKFRCDLGARRTGTAIQIGLDGSTARSRPIPLRAMRISLCKPGIRTEGRVVNVSPFEPTLRATLHG